VTTLLPLYVYPADDPDAWTAVATHGWDVTVIVNVHNGPGRRYDPAYGYACAALAEAKVPTLGYVDVDYAGRPVTDVRNDILAWRAYPVGGVFFDQVPSDLASLGWMTHAVADACGVRITDLPVTSEKVYKALRAMR